MSPQKQASLASPTKTLEKSLKKKKKRSLSLKKFIEPFEDEHFSQTSSQRNLALASTKEMTKRHSNNLSLVSPIDSEPNQELLALLACLNEQAVKEINSGDDKREVLIGQDRLKKAYKIMVETKGAKVFDANY